MASPTTPLSPAQTTAFLEGPALQPPHGVESNFTDPQGTLKAVAFGAGPVCIIVCTALVAVRLYTRFFVIKKHDAGDCEFPRIGRRHGADQNLTEAQIAARSAGQCSARLRAPRAWPPHMEQARTSGTYNGRT